MTATTMDRLDSQSRQERLNQAIRAELARGGRIESQTGDTAIVVRGNRVNHVLHVILSIITLGLWAIVWLILSLSGGERRRMLSVDEYGNVSNSDVGKGIPVAAIMLGVIILVWILVLVIR